MSKVIMTVDDSVSIRQMVSFTLKREGYDVVEAVDGVDALKKLNGDNPVHMMITDLNMPNMDGIELIKNVRANAKYKFMPVIMLTTESQEERKQAGKAAGATGWIVKPFQPEQILGVIKKVLK
jgi:two-component system, chemotaxis family, chemotaxis protein CheY